MKAPTRLTLRNKLLAFFLFFSSVPILAFSYWTIQMLNAQSEDAVLESLTGLARTKAQALETFSQNRLRNIEKLSTLSDVVQNAKTINEHTTRLKKDVDEDRLALEKEGGGLPTSVEEKRDDERQSSHQQLGLDGEVKNGLASDAPEVSNAKQALKKILNVILSDQTEFEEILVINTDGVVLSSTFEGHVGKTAKGIDYFHNGLKRTYFQPVFVSSITEKLTMVISTPLKDEGGSVVGVFAARLNLDLLFDMVEDLSGLKKTGETVVAKEIDGKIVFMAPTRHDYDAALKRNFAVGSHNLKPLQEAARGGSGTGRVIDYRDEHCLAAWAHVPSLDWGLMVKLDRDEAIAPYMEAQYRTMLLALVILFIGVLSSLYIANALVRPIRILQEAAERISKGDLDVRIAIYSRDEIGDLADSFGRMIASIKFLMEEKDKV